AVEAGGLDAPGDGEAVRLVGVHQERNGLGGFAERDRQHAGGEGIERPGVAALLGVQRAPHAADRLGRPQVLRLVEADPARDGIALAPTRHQAAPGSGSSAGSEAASTSRRTRGSSSRRRMWSAASKLSSWTNFSAGVNFMSMAAPRRRRRKRDAR